MIEKFLIFLLVGGTFGRRSEHGFGPRNTIKFMDQGNLYDHRVKQDRLRKLIVQQGNVISRTARYESSYLDSIEQIQHDLNDLLEWKKKYDPAVIKNEFDSKFKIQQSRIEKLIRERRRSRKRSRSHSRNSEGRSLTPDQTHTRSRRDASGDLHLALTQQGEQIKNLVVQVQRLDVLELQNSQLQAKVADLESQLVNSKKDVDAIKSETEQLMRTSDDREMDIPNLEAMDETQNYTLKWELQIMQSRIIELEERVNNSVYEQQYDPDLINRLEILTDQVIENTERNEIGSKTALKLTSVEQKMTRQHIQLTKLWNLRKDLLKQRKFFMNEFSKLQKLLHQEKTDQSASDRALPGLPGSTSSNVIKPNSDFVTRNEIQSAFQDINETVSDTNLILDQMKDFQDSELVKLDDKLWDNEESILKLNSTLDQVVSKIEDVSFSVNGFSQSLENFSKLYQAIRDDVEIFMVNSTANMRSFDTTVDLSIDLLDRMGTFNEEIMGRVAELEDKYFDPDMI